MARSASRKRVLAALRSEVIVHPMPGEGHISGPLWALAFEMLTFKERVRLGEVNKAFRQVSTLPSTWRSIDLVQGGCTQVSRRSYLPSRWCNCALRPRGVG
jgi:hypothetical protein